MKHLLLLLVVLLAGCLEQPASTVFEIENGFYETLEVQDVDLPIDENEGVTVAGNTCDLYKLMENHGKETDGVCEYWLFVDIYGDPCNAAAAKVCIDKPFVRCYREGFITNYAARENLVC